MTRYSILKEPLKAVNVGVKTFYDSLREQGVNAIHIDWHPPAGGDLRAFESLKKLKGFELEIEAANQKAVSKILSSEPFLVDLGEARSVIPGMRDNLILHAGPPIDWRRMCGPMKGAIIGALLFEGLAGSEKEAERLCESGKVEFSPCHEHKSVGPMAGVISASMPAFVIHNKSAGNTSYTNLNEGLGRGMRFGAYGEDVIKRLRWMKEELAPALKAAIGRSGGINLKAIIAQALQMGDEVHNRNVAATSLLLNELTPHLIDADLGKGVAARVTRFIAGNRHFFVNLSMAACKATMDAAKGIRNSTILTVMSRNGVDFGIKVSALGDRWFVAPALTPKGLYFPGYSQEDANPDLGDSAITETSGLGGFAMAAAPAIVQFIGGSPEEAVNYTREMGEITVTKSRNFTIPSLDFQGVPTGIDLIKVVETGVTPVINTGIAHKMAGIGQVGAGIVRAPMDCFKKALEALAKEMAP